MKIKEIDETFSGSIATSMGNGNGFKSGGPGTIIRRKTKKKTEDVGEDEKIVDMLRNIKQHLDNHPNMSEHPSLVALDQLADDLESGDKPADYESVSEDAQIGGKISNTNKRYGPAKGPKFTAGAGMKNATYPPKTK
tara:strand:- start:5040 stop:5450 length:411 start_codon:yes stop_codon:yes gene_type:complete